MCGVNGIYAYHYAANPVDRAELFRTRDHMAARGPDASGEYFSQEGRVGLGHRRLSIIDLSENGAQPMASRDGRFVVTFNGEIYNYRELRAALEHKGFVFHSQSDTEILLHLYADKGEAMVHELRGMFAFAIWDAARGVMFLARDPYGIKPLYYSDDGWTFRFGSQVKALLAGGAISRDPDSAGAVGFYLFGSVPEPFTTCRSIRALPAGATLLVDCTGAKAPQRYYSIAEVYRDALSTPRKNTDDLRIALLDSVRSHLVADVPVGAFLSSGIDSGALVGLMRDAGAPNIQTVTIGFEEFRGKLEDETSLAAEVARLYETRHTTRFVSRAEFEADLPRILDAMDQPTIDGVNTWFVSKAARELGLKVAISGLGGDELFGGYPSFRDLPRWAQAFSLPSRIPFLGLGTRKLLAPLTGFFGLSPKAAGMLEYGGSYAGAYLLRRGLYMPWELEAVLDRETIVQGLRRLAPLRLIDAELRSAPSNPFARVATLESTLYMRNQLLRDTDWASMAHSLEVRTPLADRTLLARLSRIKLNENEGKVALASAPSRPLPEAIIDRPKTGFTTPIDGWLRSSPSFRHVPIRAAETPQWARIWSRMVGAEASLNRHALENLATL
ncbi:asparagine synthase (glutamine-hydrolyzing) [Methylocystis sp. 9N]|uniref:asparagine synthase (glutamine-hydrolyzing) n=1 Tax=Methylocystis borbori TaxID=3118750 RepID=A0ABU7XC70_9HYPH